MGFSQAAMTCMKPLGTISGRAGRVDFGWFILGMVLAARVTSIFDATVVTLVSLALTFVLLIWPIKWDAEEAKSFDPSAAYVGTTK